MTGCVLSPAVSSCTCCLPPLPINGMFVKATKRMTLQFVLIKPVLAATSVVLAATGSLGDEGSFGAGSWCVAHHMRLDARLRSVSWFPTLCMQAVRGWVGVVNAAAPYDCSHATRTLDTPTIPRRPLLTPFPPPLPVGCATCLQGAVARGAEQHDLLHRAVRAGAVLSRLPRPAGAVQAAAQVCAHQGGRVCHVLAGEGVLSVSGKKEGGSFVNLCAQSVDRAARA